ncbi:MAG TPA: neutral zinc metallopeptidase [Acidisarcina sp.]
MDWTPGGISSDVEDRRDSSGGGGFGGGGLGIVGFVILLVISLVTGRNYLGAALGGGGGQDTTQNGSPVAGEGTPAAHPPGEDRDVQFLSYVLDDAQRTWAQTFAAQGRQYRHAKLVLYRDATPAGCGTAQSSTGPFYCPEDGKIYIDLSFWDELRRIGGDTGDAAQAYVLTHELGHHIQTLLGIEGKMRQFVEQDPRSGNHLSVDLELQADCFAGVWAHSTEQRNILHESEIPGALKAAAAVGDDHLQQMSGRAVSPESWTHGSSEEREGWFRKGLEGGTIESCGTFNGGLEP